MQSDVLVGEKSNLSTSLNIVDTTMSNKPEADSSQNAPCENAMVTSEFTHANELTLSDHPLTQSARSTVSRHIYNKTFQLKNSCTSQDLHYGIRSAGWVAMRTLSKKSNSICSSV